MLLLQGVRDFRIIMDSTWKEDVLFNYYRYASANNLPHCFIVRSIEGQDQATVLKDGEGEIIIQPETIARMLHELSEENFNNYINLLIHEYYGGTR